MNRPHPVLPFNTPRCGPRHGTARRGATLTEVLMSLLIMGLGITSVFTLFPMSILRSVKSTNLTHASLLADTARDFYLYRRETLTRPPARTLGANSYYAHAKDFLLQANPTIADAVIPEPFVGTYVVDPLGGVNASAYTNTPGRFGEVLRVANQLPDPALIAPLPSFAGVYTDLFTSNDSWVTVFEGVPTTIANTTDGSSNPVTQFVFPAGTDLSGTLIAPPATLASSAQASRIVATSFDNRQSVVRDVHRPFIPDSPSTIPNGLWVAPQIPASAFPGGLTDIGLVRVQNFERRYSYLMTMHRDELGQTRAQLVAFFRREFGESEYSFDLDPNTAGNRTIIDKRLRKITVDLSSAYKSGVAVGAGFTGRSPDSGDYIFGTWRAKPSGPGFNVIRGRWYRIVGVTQDAALPAKYHLTLDRGWEGLTDAGNQPRIMLPSGVISVFDL